MRKRAREVGKTEREREREGEGEGERGTRTPQTALRPQTRQRAHPPMGVWGGGGFGGGVLSRAPSSDGGGEGEEGEAVNVLSPPCTPSSPLGGRLAHLRGCVCVCVCVYVCGCVGGWVYAGSHVRIYMYERDGYVLVCARM